jgi:hypothetical protein
MHTNSIRPDDSRKVRLAASVTQNYCLHESNDRSADCNLVVHDLLGGRPLTPTERTRANELARECRLPRDLRVKGALLLLVHTEDGRAWQFLGCSEEEFQAACKALNKSQATLGIGSPWA